MAPRAEARAALPSAEDDFYGEEDNQGSGAQEQGRDDGRPQGPEDAALDDGQEGQDQEEIVDQQDDEDDFFAAPPSRGQHRQQTLANENRDLRRQLDELRGVSRPAAPQAPAQQVETDEQFEARIQLLSFEEKMEARYKRDRQQQHAMLQQNRVETAITADRAAFEAKAVTDKRYARWKDRVEAEFQKRRAAGQLVPREDILKWMIGDRLVNGDAEPVRRERQRAQDRVARQTTRPPGGGSDVGRGQRGRPNEREARARRLDGVQI